jgi:SOS-response transcriptional repressor LexA
MNRRGQRYSPALLNTVLRDVSTDELLEIDTVRVPVINVQCGKPDDDGEFEDSEEIPAFLFTSPTTYVLRSKGNSMEPTVEAGTLLVIEGGSTDYGHGSLVIVRTHEGIMLKRYDRSGTLRSDNPDYPPLAFGQYDTADIIGVVVYKLEKMKRIV